MIWITVNPLHMNKLHSEGMFTNPICNSSKVSQGTQSTQSVVRYRTVTGL